jgi:hypothetical protein
LWCETVARHAGSDVIRSVAVIPAAPALIPELMAGAASEVEPVRVAARQAIAAVAGSVLGPAGGPPLGRLVVVGRAAEHVEAGSRSHDLTGAFADDSFGLHLELAALPGVPVLPSTPARPESSTAHPAPQREGASWSGDAVPTPLLVARRLASDVARERPETAAVWRETLWITLSPESVDDYARSLVVDDAPIGLVVVADGAACHGPKAPRAEHPSAPTYDDAVCRALTSADPADFGALDTSLGHELSAEGADLWPLLGAAARDGQGNSSGWRAELGWRGTPYGVGWFVATWLR